MRGLTSATAVLLFSGTVLVSPAGARPACGGERATIAGTRRSDLLKGTAGRDVIAGLGGDDVVVGLGGDDVVCGGEGDDLVDGGMGSDRLRGEAGLDVVVFGRDHAVHVDAGAGVARGQGSDTFAGFAAVLGSPRADVLLGSPGADFLVGLKGDDRIEGRGGPDRLSGHEGDNVLEGGAGSDFVTLELEAGGRGYVDLARRRAFGLGESRLVSIENAISAPDGGDLYGDRGPNVLRGLGGAERIDGRAGDDRIFGGGDHDTIFDGPGDDLLVGSPAATLSYDRAPVAADVDFVAEIATGWGNDVVRDFGSFHGSAHADHVVGGQMRNVFAGKGDDVIEVAGAESVSGFDGDDTIVASGSLDGGAGDDTLTGLDGDDQIRGGDGHDFVSGGGGHDTINAGPGDNVVDGGEGSDTIDYAGSTVRTVVDLRAGTGVADGSDALTSIETVFGTIYDDVIHGTDGPEWVEASHGNDYVNAHGGNDTVNGGLDNDVIEGGDGTDRCVDGESVTGCELTTWA